MVSFFFFLGANGNTIKQTFMGADYFCGLIWGFLNFYGVGKTYLWYLFFLCVWLLVFFTLEAQTILVLLYKAYKPHYVQSLYCKEFSPTI